MPEFLYRYRPVSRLLGSSGSEGELAGSYIYFASPEQLNDPFEGYRELFFSGDEIVWRNLFKRYIACLIMRNYQYFLGLVLDEAKFPDSYDASGLPKEFHGSGAEVVSAFLSNRNVKRHVAFLANTERKVGKEELTVHLSCLQVYAMKLVAGLFLKMGAKPIESKLSTMSEEACLKASDALLSVCEVSGDAQIDPAEALYYVYALYSTEADLFLANFKAYKEQKNHQNWRVLVHNFNSQFIESLKKLSHRDWYTACFMEKCTNSALWGTYGDNHAGVCLKFKVDNTSGASKLSFTMPVALGVTGSIWKESSLPFERVNYDGEIKDLDFFRSIGIYPKNKLFKYWYLSEGNQKSVCSAVIDNEKDWIDEYWKKRQLSITTKMPDWQSENEFRLILQNGMPDYDDPKNRCLKYNFNSLDGLIFGIRTPEVEKYKILQVVEELCDKYQRTDFNIYQAFHDSTDKTIAYRPLLKVSCDSPT